ncbi:hypothetical protein [Bizionia arctica]|uniref:hypothetical protein n=1 Tax=Bizionia arctica TaxID=1495645 RepID=UPI001663AA56|nr:hypothetical protein [Bizionia arctica]
MSATIQNPVQSNRNQFLVKSFQDMSQLHLAIDKCHDITKERLQFSVLEKCKAPIANDVVLCTQQFQNLKTVLHNEFSAKSKSGLFFNPEIGTIFCIGNLSPFFLQEIDGKPLGALGTGVYGIIRGLGINEEDAKQNITELRQGNYLLFISGTANTIENLK